MDDAATSIYFDGVDCLLVDSIRTDFALIRAAYADAYGNLRFNKTARNFNPECAMAGRFTIVEVEEMTSPIPPDDVHLPGIFVQLMYPIER